MVPQREPLKTGIKQPSLWVRASFGVWLAAVVGSQLYFMAATPTWAPLANLLLLTIGVLIGIHRVLLAIARSNLRHYAEAFVIALVALLVLF